MKKIISLILVCLLLVGLAACSSEPSLIGTTPVENSTDTQAPTESGGKVFKVGDVVELDGVTVTFVGISKSSGSEFNKPEDGNEYVLCEFEIANNSGEDISVSSLLNFEAYYDDYACDLSIGALMEKGNKDQLDGTIAAGKKMKGVIGYEIPTTWKELEVHYSLGLLTNKEIVFVVANS